MYKFVKYAVLIFILSCLSLIVHGASYFRLSDDHLIGDCGKFDICNIVHRPYLGKNTIQKLCKCPENTSCSATFSDTDESSLLINPRSQMKFCFPIKDLFEELPSCEESPIAIQIKSSFNNSILMTVSATMTCACDKHPVYWKYHSREGENFQGDQKIYDIIDNYECSNLTRCETNEFCGFARSDYGFIFQRCTCSTHDDCRFYVEEEDIEDNVEELFYNELLYKAHCLRNELNDEW